MSLERLHARVRNSYDESASREASPDRQSFRTGLIGAAIQQSGSPAIHTEEARALGLDYSYALFDLDLIEGGVDALAAVLTEIEEAGFAGVNVTHPCKQKIIALLSELSPDAEALGAVNTVVFKQGARFGHNTDCVGFAQSLALGLPHASLEAVCTIGAGGGGAAVAYALLGAGARALFIHDVDAANAQALANRLAPLFPRARVRVSDDLVRTLTACDGVVNCTPVGMAKYPGLPLPGTLIAPRLWVADIVYFPLETELLRTARERGCATLDGGAMAVFQAAEAFRLFTGHTPDGQRMLQRFRAAAADAVKS